MEVVDRTLYRFYRRFYSLGFFKGIQGLTGDPRVDLQRECVRKVFFLYYEKRSPEKERIMRQLAKVLGISERDAYELYRNYRRKRDVIDDPLLRSFFGNLPLITSRDRPQKEKALKKLKEVLKLIKKEEVYAGKG